MKAINRTLALSVGLMIINGFLSAVTPEAQAVTCTPVDFPEAAWTSLGGINNLGVMVGRYEDSSGIIKCLVLEDFGLPTETWTSFGCEGAVSTKCFDINDSGVIVGEYKLADLIPRGFRYDGLACETVSWPDSLDSPAEGINNPGLIVGSYDDEAGVEHGFLYDGQTHHPIHCLGAEGGSSAEEITDSGRIVGDYIDNMEIEHPYWADSADCVAQQPCTCNTFDHPDGPGADIEAVNNLNHVVGGYDPGTGTVYGFYYDGTSWTTFDCHGSVDTWPHGINDAGLIVGSYEELGGATRHGFILDINPTPTPTPTPTATPTPTPTPAPPIQGEIKMRVQLKFNKPLKDKIEVKVKNWTGLPPGLVPADVTVNVGGAEFTGTLDAKGKYKSPDKRDSIKMKEKNGLWRITVKRKNNDFAADLADEGLTDADNPKPGVQVIVPLTIEVGGVTYGQDVSLVYKSKLGKKGTAK